MFATRRYYSFPTIYNLKFFVIIIIIVILSFSIQNKRRLVRFISSLKIETNAGKSNTLAKTLSPQFEKFDFRDCIIAPWQNIRFSYGEVAVSLIFRKKTKKNENFFKKNEKNKNIVFTKHKLKSNFKFRNTLMLLLMVFMT